MKRVFLAVSIISALSAFGGEMRYGYGAYTLKGGFLGFVDKESTDLHSYSLAQQHKEFFDSNWYYAYNVTWYDSEELLKAQQSFDTATAQNLPSNPFGTTSTVVALPAMKYRYQGLDAEGFLGYDISRKGENDFVGIGIGIGISAPWIESEKDSDNTTNDTSLITDAYKKSTTEFLTLKIGPSAVFRKRLNEIVIFYGTLYGAYQSARVKNDYAGTDSSSNGLYFEVDGGVRLQLFSRDKELGPITLSPRLYADVGYRYSYWTLKDIAVDISGSGIVFDKSDIQMSASTLYFGIGYSF